MWPMILLMSRLPGGHSMSVGLRQELIPPHVIKHWSSPPLLAVTPSSPPRHCHVLLQERRDGETRLSKLVAVVT